MSSSMISRFEGFNADVAFKAPVRVVSTTNIALSGLQTIDSVALADGDRVLVAGQTSAADNGVWVARSGAWSRALDFNGTYDVAGGTTIRVNQGDGFSNTYWSIFGNGPKIVGTDPLTINQVLQPFYGDAFITLEQFGAAATFSTSANDQPYFQSAITAAMATGIPIKLLRDYNCYATTRTSFLNDQMHPSGHYAVAYVSTTKNKLSIIADKQCTIFFKGLNGVNPNTNWQQIATTSGGAVNAVWRGTALKILRETAGSSWLHCTFVRHNVVFDGCTSPTQSKTFPASFANGEGWDYTHRPMDSADTNIAFSHYCTGMSGDYGWRGEVWYGVGGPSTLAGLNDVVSITGSVPIFYVRGWKAKRNNVNNNNMGGHIYHDVADIEIDGGVGGEVLTPQGGVYSNVTFRNTNGGTYCGGPYPDYPANQIFMQARDKDARMPRLVMRNITLDNAAASWNGTPGGNASGFRFGGFVSVEGTAIDTPIGVFPTIGRYADITFDVETMLDRLPDRAWDVFDISQGPLDLTTLVDGQPAAITLTGCSVAAGTATLTTTGNPALLPEMTLVGTDIPPSTRIISGSGNTWTLDRVLAAGAASATRTAAYYKEPMVNIRGEFRVSRSKAAINAGRRWRSALTGYGLVDSKSVQLRFTGEGVTDRIQWWIGFGNRQGMPLIDESQLTPTYDFGSFDNGQTATTGASTVQIIPNGQFIQLQGTGGAFELVDPVAVGTHVCGYSGNQVAYITNRSSGNCTITQTGTNWNFISSYTLAPGERLELRRSPTSAKWNDGIRRSVI